MFGLSIRGVAKASRNARLQATAKLLSLSHLLDRRPSQLSGGQQQRVALGRALIAETPVCLLDEPLSNLDAQLRAEMRGEIRSLQQRLALTMLFVTHDQTEAMSMADRIILMRAGQVEQCGAPFDLYEKPASTFVARFIGTPPMNVIEIDPGLVPAGDAAVRRGARAAGAPDRRSARGHPLRGFGPARDRRRTPSISGPIPSPPAASATSRFWCARRAGRGSSRAAPFT